MKKNDVLEVVISDVTYQGFGVTKVDGFPVFIENTLRDEKVLIKIVKVLKKFAFGIVLEMIQESPYRVDLKDEKGLRIGTMPLQHMAYEEQLRFKKGLVYDVFHKLVDMEQVELHETLGMEVPWEYRNKAQVPVGIINGQLETGFYKKGSHDLVPVEDFYIQDPKIDQSIILIRDILRKYDVSVYNEKTHKGTIRNIGIRRSKVLNQTMVILVCTQENFRHKQEVLEEIWNSIDDIVSLVVNINPDRTNVIMGKRNIVEKGQAYYEDMILGLKYKISAASFFQINPEQTEKLYQSAINLASITETDHVVDAYCGIGSITLSLAKAAKHVYGMDIVEDAIAMAKDNAINNLVENVTFEAGDAANVITQWKTDGLSIDVLVVDPPRKGLDTKFIEQAISFDPKRIVYVSCNPATQARDVAAFIEAGYTLKSLQPVDMFPQTLHVETVVLMSRVDK